MRREEGARVERSRRGARRARERRRVFAPNADLASGRALLGETQSLQRVGVIFVERSIFRTSLHLGPAVRDVRQSDVLVAHEHAAELASDGRHGRVHFERHSLTDQTRAEGFARRVREGLVARRAVAATLVMFVGFRGICGFRVSRKTRRFVSRGETVCRGGEDSFARGAFGDERKGTRKQKKGKRNSGSRGRKSDADWERRNAPDATRDAPSSGR